MFLLFQFLTHEVVSEVVIYPKEYPLGDFGLTSAKYIGYVNLHKSGSVTYHSEVAEKIKQLEDVLIAEAKLLAEVSTTPVAFSKKLR